MSLAQSTVRGVIWNFSELLLRRGLAAATTLLLTYFLSPADFGLISMLSLFLAVAAGLMDSGLKEALVRRRRLSVRLLNTTLWASLGLGVLAYVLLYCAAPWVANFYDQPRLVVLIRVIGVVILFNALQTAPVARLTQALDFKALIRASLPAAVFSCLLALGMAYAGFGVWALIAQSLASAAVGTLLIWKTAGWRPNWQVDWRPLAALYRFGYKLFFSSLVALTVRNAVPSMLGKFLGATPAGYYYFVDKIMEMIMGQLVYSIQNVTYPAFSKISKETEQLREAYRKVVEVMAFMVSPLLMIGAGLADPLFEMCFSSQWWPAASCFRWLCIAYLMYPLHALNLNILKVKGRSDIFLWLELVKATIALGILWFTLPLGLQAVLWGQVCVSMFCYLPNAMYSKSLIGYSVTKQVRDVLPYFCCAALSGLGASYTASYLEGRGALFVVLLGALSALILYLLLCRLLKLRAWVLMASALGSLLRGRA